MSVESPARLAEGSVINPVPQQPAAVLLPRRIPVLAGLAMLAAGGVAGVFAGRQMATPPAAAAIASPAEKPGDSDTLTFAAEKQASAGVEVLPLTPTPLVAYSWRTGRVAVHDDRIAHVCPPADGVVREVQVRIGQTVAAGDVLAVIDSRELGLAKLEAYKARIALSAEQDLAARARTTTANADELLQLLTADTPLADIEKRMAEKPIGEWRQQLLGAYTRRNQLRAQLAAQQSSAGAVPEANLRKTEAESEAAGAVYTALAEELRFQVKNQVRQAELKLKDAETAADVTKAKLLMFGLSAEAVGRLDPVAEGAAVSHLALRSPFAGTVVEKHAVRSERVGPQTQMFVVADLSGVWVQADVFEADLPLFRGLESKSVLFRSVAAGIPERTANVVYTGDMIDKSSRTLTLTAEAANPDRFLKPGMFVEVGFDTGDRTPTLQVPAAAVLRHDNKPFVFVQTGGDTFHRTEVALGRTGGENVEITAGLKAGDRVVVRGGFVLKSELLKDQMVGE